MLSPQNQFGEEIGVHLQRKCRSLKLVTRQLSGQIKEGALRICCKRGLKLVGGTVKGQRVSQKCFLFLQQELYGCLSAFAEKWS